MDRGALHLVQALERGLKLGALVGQDARQLAAVTGRLLDVVDDQALCYRLDEIEHVVKATAELVDVLSVERRDEGVLQAPADLAVDPVALLLERLDVAHALV